MSTAVYYCKFCRANVLEETWDADKQKCTSCSGRPSKYRAKKTVLDGITFASQKEAEHYHILKARLQAGEISNLRLQPTYPIVINGKKIARYIADFQYVDCSTQKMTVEDVKSAPTRTPIYRLKKKLVEALYPITITEV